MILKKALELLYSADLEQNVRLIGITLSNEIKKEKPSQLTLKL
jgi:hypothetical protein